MTNTEKFMEMVEMQENTDALIFKKMRLLTPPQPSEYKLAIVDEVGELNHELKGRWCWWQATPTPIVWEKVREELVDVWHFCLSYLAHHIRFDREQFAAEIDYEKSSYYDPIDFLSQFMYPPTSANMMKNVFEYLIGIGNNLGFDFEAVYQAYKQKNAENNDRAETNY